MASSAVEVVPGVGPGDVQGNAGQPSISVDDTALLEASCSPTNCKFPQRPYRSRSPSSLELCSAQRSAAAGAHDRLSPSALRPSSMQKCLSFPRIAITQGTNSPDMPPGVFYDPAAAAPRSGNVKGAPSVTNLGEIDAVSMIGHVGLLRSISARTIDSLVNQLKRSSVASSDSGSRWLSPYRNQKDTLCIRSTSCPQMAYPLRRTAGPSFHVQNAANNDQDGDIDLTGEIITDLPINPDFPDLLANLKDSPDCRNANIGFYQASGITTSGITPEVTTTHVGNIRLPSSNMPLKEAWTVTGKTGTQRDGNFNVDPRDKCLRWLKSLSSTDQPQ